MLSLLVLPQTKWIATLLILNSVTNNELNDQVTFGFLYILGEDDTNLLKTLNSSSLNIKYSTIEKATGCFAEANKLGQGGFGIVYKVVLKSRSFDLIKHLSQTSLELLPSLCCSMLSMNFFTGCSSKRKRDCRQKTFLQPPT